ncbi:hypothetical protein AY601_2402 [Pedobacter cryoconitis]|uniref:Sphingomyelin synthase-like domain-containing protein n=1 Tax=Pedobacter cryoconitis TaxID=188932 RepID=A0A127VD54_9SPHI|nr:phosphatase PAP2-related protein [Pedobacter cryoconitis]AMP99296.1 hypothetical protein AY601_2402 [Pedobacter cryoconitis]
MQTKQLTWQFAWEYPAFRVKFILGILMMVLILFYIQDFFLFIQARNGVLMDDWVLSRLPAHDVSRYIFLIINPAIVFFIWRIIKNTSMCITALWGYIFFCVARMITILLIPLDAPVNLVHLTDPFLVLIYGSNMITKDLFFSGHTATLCLIGLCLENKNEKVIIFIATGILGVLLLVQHVHYTADVLAAPVFSYLFWYLGRTVARI